MFGRFVKLMLKKLSLIFIIILTVFSLGCTNFVYVSIDLPKEMNLNRNIASPIEISYKSDYSEPQNVAIAFNTSNSRLGLSLNKSGPYQQTLYFTEEVGINYQNKKIIYVNTTDSSIPPGDYTIGAGIKGEKSNERDWIIRYTTVHISP